MCLLLNYPIISYNLNEIWQYPELIGHDVKQPLTIGCSWYMIDFSYSFLADRLSDLPILSLFQKNNDHI